MRLNLQFRKIQLCNALAERYYTTQRNNFAVTRETVSIYRGRAAWSIVRRIANRLGILTMQFIFTWELITSSLRCKSIKMNAVFPRYCTKRTRCNYMKKKNSHHLLEYLDSILHTCDINYVKMRLLIRSGRNEDSFGIVCVEFSCNLLLCFAFIQHL